MAKEKNMEQKMNQRTIRKNEDDWEVSFNDDSETRHKIYNKLLEWYLSHCISGEGIQQDDDSIIDAPNVLSDIADDIFCFKVEDYGEDE